MSFGAQIGAALEVLKQVRTARPPPKELLGAISRRLLVEHQRVGKRAERLPRFFQGPRRRASAFARTAARGIHGAFPNHRVLRVSLVEDGTPGVTYYDSVTAFDLTLGTEGQWQPERRGQND